MMATQRTTVVVRRETCCSSYHQAVELVGKRWTGAILFVLMDGPTRFSEFTAPNIESRTFPESVKLSIWTAKQKEPITSGLAYLYFFPQGFTERAMLHIRQGSNVWTLTVSPLTGKTAVVAEELEVPRS